MFCFVKKELNGGFFRVLRIGGFDNGGLERCVGC